MIAVCETIVPSICSFCGVCGGPSSVWGWLRGHCNRTMSPIGAGAEAVVTVAAAQPLNAHTARSSPGQDRGPERYAARVVHGDGTQVRRAILSWTSWGFDLRFQMLAHPGHKILASPARIGYLRP